MWAILGAAVLAFIILGFIWSSILVFGCALFVAAALATGSILYWAIAIVLGILVLTTSNAV
jgi:hypothetical protein